MEKAEDLLVERLSLMVADLKRENTRLHQQVTSLQEEGTRQVGIRRDLEQRVKLLLEMTEEETVG